MTDLKSQMTEATELVAHGRNQDALKIVEEILADLVPPNRVDIPPARVTVYDWLQAARKSLKGEAQAVFPPRAALNSALKLLGVK